MSRARINPLKDAYNALLKIKKSNENKVVKKSDFHELKSKVKNSRETKEGTEDKFMMMIRRNKAKKQMDKFHITAIIERSIHYPDKKTGITKYTYEEKNHPRQLVGHDKLTDSRIIEATSLEEAKQIFYDEIKIEQEYEEYSSLARILLSNVQFIDDEPIRTSQITSSNVKQMPLRQVGHLQYNFTQQETKFLTNENTCVIDNLYGLYGKELKLNKDKIIQLNKKFHGFQEDNEPQYIESDFGDMIVNPKYYEGEYNKTQHEYYIDEIYELKEYINNVKSYVSPRNKPVYNIDNAFTPEFIDFF